MPEHTVQLDHPVQRAYLKRWCHRRNHVYFLDLRNEQAGWELRHLEDDAFVVPDGDKLSDGEVEQLNRAAEKLRTETPLDQFADQMEVRRLRELPDKPIDRSSKSSRVSTALTPGRASAFEVSIDVMRAWG